MSEAGAKQGCRVHVECRKLKTEYGRWVLGALWKRLTPSPSVKEKRRTLRRRGVSREARQAQPSSTQLLKLMRKRQGAGPAGGQAKATTVGLGLRGEAS